MICVTHIKKLKLFDCQASDDKRALRGRQPTSFIASIWFVLCYFKLFCRYIVQICCKKAKKNWSPLTRRLARPCLNPAPKKQQNGRGEARPVPVEAQPCTKILAKKPIFLLIQQIVSFSLPFSSLLFSFLLFSSLFFFKSLRTMLLPSGGGSQ